MALPQQQSSARQKTGAWLVAVIAVVVVAALAYLFLSPSSPLRPQASELNAVTTNPVGQATFRDGTVGKVSGGKVTVDETNGGSFTFTLNDDVVVRSLNADNKFEVVDSNRLGTGDAVSVFYQETDSGLLLSRVDILQDK